jgi:hypothetical protein
MRGIVPVLAGSLPVASLLLVFPAFIDSNRAYKELDVVLPVIEKNSAIAELELGSNMPGRVFSMAAAGGRALPVRGGRAIYSFTDSSIAAVRMYPEHEWNDSLGRVLYDSYGFRPDVDCDRYRYILAHVPGGAFDEIAKRAFAPDAKPLAENGEWLLLESTHYRVPMTAPDGPLPKPAPPSLRKRMKLTYARMLTEAGTAAAGAATPEEIMPSVSEGDMLEQ